MVSLSFDLSEIGFPHHIRSEIRHKAWDLDETRPGYMYIESCPIINLAENLSNRIWIHQSQSAINEEFKFWSRQGLTVQLTFKGVRFHKASTNVTKYG